ncbi:pre-mRNA-processing factor 39-2-like isoform X2 [Wolffia australiana]
MSSNLFDFSSWTSFISEIEKTSSDDSSAISRAYESFLSEYPLCYDYWKKYASHKARLSSSTDQVVEVFEKAVNVATYSVDLWADYCCLGMQLFEDIDDVRRLYKRSLSFIGKDYRASLIWDQWLAFEHSNKHWNHLIDVYIKSLRFPTKRLHHYYQSLKALVTRLEEKVRYQTTCMDIPEGLAGIDFENLSAIGDSQLSRIISGALDRPDDIYRSQTLNSILTVGEYFYRTSLDIDKKISHFESQIRRHHFHVKSLDDNQLRNWHHYLDFVDAKYDFDWTVKLYERCLIPCANYPDFWVRYIEHMEANGGRELATHAIERAGKTFLKVKEHIGDACGAQGSLHSTESDLLAYSIDSIIQQANLQKRLGNWKKANLIYLKGIDMVKDKQDLHAFCLLYTHFARFRFLETGNLRAAREVFFEGISRAPHCKLLYEELIKFMCTHCAKGDVSLVDTLVSRALEPEPGTSLTLSPSEREEISKLLLEFVDLCGTPHEIRKAWARHWRVFPPIVPAADNPNIWEESKRMTIRKDPEWEATSKGNLLTTGLGKETNLGSQGDKENLKPSLENISSCHPPYDKPSPSGPMSKMRGEKEESNVIGQQYHKQTSIPSVPHIQHQQSAIYAGFDPASAMAYPQPNYVTHDQVPVSSQYQQYQWPVVYQVQGEDGSSSSQHHPQILTYQQYQAQYWHHYYQQQQLYYMQQHQQQERPHQQQPNSQAKFLELHQVREKTGVEHFQQQKQQQEDAVQKT